MHADSIRKLARLLETTEQMEPCGDVTDFIAFDLEPIARAFCISMLEMLWLYANEDVSLPNKKHRALCLALRLVDGVKLARIKGISTRYELSSPPVMGVELLEIIPQTGMLDTKNWKGTYMPGVEKLVLSSIEVWHFPVKKPS